MHTIKIPKKVNGLLAQMYILGIAKIKGIDLPNQVKLITPDDEKTYNISGFSIDEIKVNELGT